MRADLVEYFSRRDTPSAASPVGKAMQALVVLYPDRDFEDLRREANERMHGGGPGRVKWTPEERKAMKRRKVSI